MSIPLFQKNFWGETLSLNPFTDLVSGGASRYNRRHMSKLQVLYYPDPRLREVSNSVDDLDEIREFLPAMFEIMYQSRGIGLAAPQVGIQKRFFIANISGSPEEKDQERVFVNPVIVESQGEMKEIEGCLSLPGMEATVRRAEAVVVDIGDMDGRRQQVEAEGLFSKLFQHEIDHLDGILMLDKITPAEQKKWAPLLKDLESDFKNNIRRPHTPSHAGL